MLDTSMYDAKEWQDQLVGQGSPELDDENYKKNQLKNFVKTQFHGIFF